MINLLIIRFSINGERTPWFALTLPVATFSIVSVIDSSSPARAPKPAPPDVLARTCNLFIPGTICRKERTSRLTHRVYTYTVLAEILFQPYYFIVSYRQLSSGQGYQVRSGIVKKPASPVGFFTSVYICSGLRPESPVENCLLNFTKYGKWWMDVEYISRGVPGKSRLMFDSREQAQEVQEGFRFLT